MSGERKSGGAVKGGEAGRPGESQHDAAKSDAKNDRAKESIWGSIDSKPSKAQNSAKDGSQGNDEQNPFDKRGETRPEGLEKERKESKTI